MPLYDGLYAIEHIRKINPSARIVVISNSISDEIKFQLKNASIPIIDKSYELAKIQEYLEKLTITSCQPWIANVLAKAWPKNVKQITHHTIK